MLAHLGRPKGEVNPKYSLAPAAKRLSELLGAEVTLAERRGRPVGPGRPSPGSPTATSRMLENVRYEPGEESKDEAVRGELADRYAALGDVFVSDGFGVVHRKQAQRLRPGPAAAQRGRRPGRGRGRGAQAADRGPGPPVRGGARRRQGLRQARRDRQPAQDRRHAGDRWRDALHLPGRPGPRGGQEPARGRPDRDGQGLPRRGGGHRQADRAADRHRRGAGVQGRRAADRGRRRRHPGRPARAGHRPGVGQGLRRR